MIVHVSACQHGPELVKDGAQCLNPIDRSIRCIDLVARQLGYPGIGTQMLVWLEGRADAAALRRAIARLGNYYPVMTSRLIETDRQGRPYWRFRPGAACRLAETRLPSDDPQAVLERAADILSAGPDPTAADPLDFHLLHRPDGKDVFLLQYNHVLMDNRAAVPLLREIERLSPRRPAAPLLSEPGDLVWEHLRQFPRERRREVAQAAAELQTRVFRGRAATLLPIAPPPTGPARLEIVSRRLDARSSSVLRGRIVALCGFPCISMAVLGSAFRAIDRLGPPDDSRQHFAAGIGIPIPANGQAALVFQNVTSAISLRVGREDLLHRDRLTRLLSDQLRQRLADGVDLGILGMAAAFSRRYRYVEWAVWHLVHYAYSLWFGYFGSLEAVGKSFCGSAIEDLFHTGGPIWPSIALSLLVNQYGGHLNFQATYDARLIPPPLAEAFLDFLLADLIAE